MAAGCMFCFDKSLKSTIVPSEIKSYNVVYFRAGRSLQFCKLGLELESQRAWTLSTDPVSNILVNS
jgi:hypothetical protein